MVVGRMQRVYKGKTTKVFRKKTPKRKITMSQLPRAVIPEMKRKNTIVENQMTTVLGNQLGPITAPFYIAEGSGPAYRVGRHLRARGLHIKGHFFNKTGNPAFFIRMVVIQDKQDNHATFIGDEFLMKQSVAVAHSQGTESAYLSINKNRYKVYSDKLIKLSASNINAENLKIFNTFIKLNHLVKYDGPGTGDIANNNIQIAYWPVNPSGAVIVAQQIEANYSTTCYYQDP